MEGTGLHTWTVILPGANWMSRYEQDVQSPAFDPVETREYVGQLESDPGIDLDGPDSAGFGAVLHDAWGVVEEQDLVRPNAKVLLDPSHVVSL